MPNERPSLLIPTRHFRGLSGKVILLKNNIPTYVAAGWRVMLLAEKIDADMTRDLGAEPYKIWGAGFNKRHKVKRFMRQAEQFAAKQAVDLVVGHGDTLHQDVLHIHSCRHREYEESTGKTLQPGEKATADFQAQQLTEGRYSRLVANSGLMRDDLAARFPLDPAKVSIIYPGHDPLRFCPQPDAPASRKIRADLGVGDNTLIGLVTSGKLHLRGADLLIEAVANLPRELREQQHLLIVGDGDFTPFKQQAQQAGLAERVHFMKPQAAVEDIFRALDLYVNPARFETFSMSVLEAMACGIPSITTRQVGIAELFTERMREAVMEQVEAPALSACLQGFLTDRQRLQAHAEDCRAAAAPLTWEQNTQAHLEIYNAVLAGKLAQSASSRITQEEP